ncbi:zinc finger BED domain-containing protein isoform X2 [Alosa alosa]|uniref:zinc finger BED domain-containing protein isoform X2 n=1 Tax=Alosa sapidissima TaxID=34773 RepID=UPI001C0954C8|nr:zinc finger BED domain-containing protein isoform X2 [Alosa sapidissima]XP_048119578.1 zinc finger BED domain-containing protein isoform X2 [Alosa alosa]
MATRKRSIVWSFFKEEDDKQVVCLICMRTIHHFGKTTNMLRHLRSEHPGEFSDFNFESIVTGLTAKTARNTKNNISNGLVEAVMLGEPERAPQENGIEDMEVHGVIEGILCASAGQGPSSDQNSELGNADEVTVTTHSRKRSAVWMHYQKVDDEKKALCMLCKEKIQHQSSTSNLLRHLRKKHPSNFSQLEMNTLQHAGGQKIYHMNTPQASTDLIVNCHTEAHQSNQTGTSVNSAVRRPNHQLNAEAVMLGSPEKAPPENGIEDMEVHGAIQGILRAAAGQGPSSDQNSSKADAEGVTAAAPSRKCSAVWVHYRKVDDEKRALCLLCKKKIQHHSSTSNLLRHLQKKHPSHFSQLEVHSLKHTGGRKTHTDIQRSNHTNAPSSAVNSPNCQLVVEQHLQSTCYSSNSCPGLSESHVLQRERELTEALRRVQREEGKCLEQQRELLEKSRELQAETHALHTERCALQEEAKMLQKEKEEIQADREKLQNEKNEVERLKQELKDEQAMLLGQRPEANLMCDL